MVHFSLFVSSYSQSSFRVDLNWYKVHFFYNSKESGIKSLGRWFGQGNVANDHIFETRN